MATVIPRLRRAGDLESEPAERARVEADHRTQDRSLPTRATPGFAKDWAVEVADIGFPSHVLTPRGRRVHRTLYYLHGGAFMAPIDAVHVRFQQVQIPRAFIGRNYDQDEAYRLAFQQWVNQLWEEKDAELASLLQAT